MTTSPHVSRKAFIQSLGASCKNWTWSWSFVNHPKRMIIFGAWDIRKDGDKTLILSKEWEFINGRRSFGYPQSLEHLQPVNEKAYELYTFGIRYSDKRKTRNGDDPSSIAGFERSITRKWLQEDDGNWFACDQPS